MSFRPVVLLTALLFINATALAESPGDGLRVGRYTTVDATPTPQERDPLRAVVSVHFPRPEVRTVADAIGYILPRTGYRLSPESLSNKDLLELLGQPLPESHRVLGPYTVEAVLQTLVGEGFKLTPDVATRRITVLAVSANSTAGSE